MSETRQTQPAPVPITAKRAGETRPDWDWVEASVWTDRMLTALETGVKGGRWYSLMDKVCRIQNLRAAFAKVKANRGAPGSDHQTIAMFEKHLERNLEAIARGLITGNYRPREVKRTWIPKPGTREKRPLGIPTVRDRIAQTALRNVLEPIFEADFAPNSYGFRPNRGCKDALRQVDELLKQGYVWVVDADLRNYFDTIPKAGLMERIRTRIADGKVLKLLERYLNQKVLEASKEWTPEAGTPQGAVISPMLANLYLDPLDHEMAAAGIAMIRYADDFVILCRTRQEAEAALARVQVWVEANGLSLHPDKTRIVEARQHGEGFDFLGFHFDGRRRWPRKKSLKKLRDKIRAKTKRTNGHSLDEIVKRINRTLRGWFEYFKHSYPTTFPHLDGWVRMRLRSILRKRSGRRGKGRGEDHHRWPNAFFVEHGLFSTVTAYESTSQSRQGG